MEYEGTRYAGWQVQPGDAGQVTLEATLVAALSRLFNHPVQVTASGRTDAGVHARQQVVNVFTTSRITPTQVLRGGNSLLPDDMAITRVLEVSPDWNARRSAIRRTYRYCMLVGPARHPLQRATAYHYRRGKLDLPAMQAAAQVLVGTHDFSAFRCVHCDARNPVRHVFSCDLRQEGELLTLEISAWAFLRHMVRIIMGTLIRVGEGKLTAEEVRGILAGRDRGAAGPTAPACGLILWEVQYP
ncbi:tRNA pseudouridine(38-40) synthase TruA [bacterium]|nr:tRNA pseudouridine(38-40) synthase TruA [bacterium]